MKSATHINHYDHALLLTRMTIMPRNALLIIIFFLPFVSMLK